MTLSERLTPFLVLWAATYVQVFMRVFQQLNVIHHDYWLVPIGSYGMSFTELLIVAYGGVRVAAGQKLFPTAFSIGTGGWMGAWTCMYLYG
jgi:hypothetical protein